MTAVRADSICSIWNGIARQEITVRVLKRPYIFDEIAWKNKIQKSEKYGDILHKNRFLYYIIVRSTIERNSLADRRAKLTND